MLEERREALKVALEVRDIFRDESRWTSGCFSRDSNGIKVSLYDSSATCWCISGAFHIVTLTKKLEEWIGYPSILRLFKSFRPSVFEYASSIGENPLWLFNDRAGYYGVVHFLDYVIENLQNEIKCPVDA